LSYPTSADRRPQALDFAVPQIVAAADGVEQAMRQIEILGLPRGDVMAVGVAVDRKKWKFGHEKVGIRRLTDSSSASWRQS